MFEETNRVRAFFCRVLDLCFPRVFGGQCLLWIPRAFVEIRFVFFSITRVLESDQGSDREKFSEFSYNAYTMLILGILESSVIPAIPASSFFLTLSRCCIIRFHRISQEFYERLFSSLSIITGVIFAFINTVILLRQFPSDSKTDCWSFICLTGVEYSFFFMATKMIFGFLNIIFGLMFLYSLRNYTKHLASASTSSESFHERRKVCFFKIFLIQKTFLDQ